MGTEYRLHDWHVSALEWFELNARRTFDKRPFNVGLPVKLTSSQMGIWKPKGTPYALSVVQTRKGVYADLDPLRANDGTWVYYYHQQGKTPDALRNPGQFWANAALFRCKADHVPIGVVIPSDSSAGYEVLGLATIERYANGLFTLVGPVSLSAGHAAGVSDQKASVTISLLDWPPDGFDPHAEHDHRLKVVSEVFRRQGGPRFRRALLSAYEGRCAMSRYDATGALEAAHIIPYRGPQTNHLTNGLLLRADLHDLFDLGLIAVDTDSMRLQLAEELSATMYEPLHNERLWLPSDPELRPNIEALNMHRAQSSVA